MRSSLPCVKFIADDMLGKLAKRLRLIGFDVSYPRVSADSLLLRKSQEENRIILTRDTGLIKIRGANTLLIRSIKLSDQVKEVLKALKLKIIPGQMSSRCTLCNSKLVKINKEKVKGKVPPLVYKLFNEFTRCPSCEKIYWKGTHYEKMISDL